MDGKDEELNRQEFMSNALGADEDTMMTVLNRLLASVDMAFTEREAFAMREMLADPEVKMLVATLLTDGAEKAGVLE